MDENQAKVVIAVVAGLVALITLVMGYNFLAAHWEDIKTLAIVALVLGGTLTVAVGGFKLHSRR